MLISELAKEQKRQNSMKAGIKIKQFSIVIPTYTGMDHIVDCFDSILKQDDIQKFHFDVIVVIDGPNRALRKIVDKQSERFADKGIDFHVYQFSENRGRFTARQKGAKESKNEYLLFIDDRNNMAHNYLKEVLRADKDALIPNVLEGDHPHFIAKTMYFIRKSIYKGRWGEDFVSYEINKDNFETSSKGTTSFWVKKDVFLASCSEIGDKSGDIRTMNDDTKLMRHMVNNGMGIYKSSEAKIYYQPRKSMMSEIKHLFHRGPMFIDYYLRPGTRFFIPLILFYLTVLVLLFLALVAPSVLLLFAILGFVITFFATFYIVGFSINVFFVFMGLVIISGSFGLGLLKGIIIKILKLAKGHKA